MRPPLLHAATSRLLRHLVVWVLVLALPVNAVSNTLLHMLGATHRHGSPVESVDSMGAWNPEQVLRAVVGDSAMAMIQVHKVQRQAALGLMKIPEQASAQTQPHAHGPATPAHSHGLFERHHHDLNDSTVVELGAKQAGHDAPGSAGGADVGAVALLALPAVLALAPAPANRAWRGFAAGAWQSHVSTPLERPPRA